MQKYKNILSIVIRRDGERRLYKGETTNFFCLDRIARTWISSDAQNTLDGQIDRNPGSNSRSFYNSPNRNKSTTRRPDCQ